MEENCEICGKEDAAVIVRIEGATLSACRRCAGSNKIVSRIEHERTVPHAETRTLSQTSEEIIDGYGKVIRKKREQFGLPIAVVAERINEKESYLDHIEKEELVPTIAVARKLERELGVKIIETMREEVLPSSARTGGGGGAITLGDFVDIKKKK